MNDPLNLRRILNAEVQRFLRDHENDDEKLLVLKQKQILGLPSAQIAQQIVGRRKAKTKLPDFYNSSQIFYPPKLNLEQCSSERTALYKSSLKSGVVAVDLTGGFGVDSYFLSKRFEKVIHIEPDKSLLEIAKHNHFALGAKNIEYHGASAESFLQSNNEQYDLIYLDPSRRSNSNRKVFRFSDCSPNVVTLLPGLSKRSKSILIKASPLVDIQLGIHELGSVSQVYIVGIDNECKEVLFLISNKNTEPIVEVIDLTSNASELFTFSFVEERRTKVNFSDPLTYLYEPSAMILKSGSFKLAAKRFNLSKLASNTHLYTSEKLTPEFPGRIFNIEAVLKSDSKNIRDALPKGYANIITRNYPLTPSQLKKKLKIQDGGKNYIIAFSGQQKKYLVLASRIK